jgi:hypothetical protein
MSLDTLFIQPNIVCYLLMNPVCTILSLWLVYKTIESFRSGTWLNLSIISGIQDQVKVLQNLEYMKPIKSGFASKRPHNCKAMYKAN